MPSSKAEQALEALKALLETVPGAVVERNSALPEKIPDGGLIILRDGDPGEPEQALGGFGNAYYQHAVEIEVYVEEGDAAARDAAFDTLLQQIGVALEADPTLGGVAFGLTYGRPEPVIEAITGASAIKSATLSGHVTTGSSESVSLADTTVEIVAAHVAHHQVAASDRGASPASYWYDQSQELHLLEARASRIGNPLSRRAWQR
jgi:hypothetical protein